MMRQHIMRIHRSVCALAAALALVWMVCAAPYAVAADEVRSLRMTQCYQNGETLQVFFDALSDAGARVETLKATNATVTVGKKALTGEIASIQKAGVGMRYVFLVDISNCYTNDQFDQVRTGLNGAIAQMGPADYAAIVTMGETTQTACELTNTKDNEKLYTCVNNLQKAEKETVSLDQGIAAALTQATIQNGQYPAHGTVILISGVHQNPYEQYASKTSEQLAQDVQSDSLLFHVITFAPSNDYITNAVDELGDLATASNGNFDAAQNEGTQKLGEILTADMAQAAAGYVATAYMPESLGTSEDYGVQLDLTEGDIPLNTSGQVRIVPFQSDHNGLIFRVLCIIAGILAAGLVVIFILYRRYQKKHKAAMETQYQQWLDSQLAQQLQNKEAQATAEAQGDFSTGVKAKAAASQAETLNHGNTVALFPDEAPEAEGETAILTPPPAASLRVTLQEIREDGQKEHVFDVTDSLVIGRECGPGGLQVEDGAASRRHCALFAYQGALYVRDLGSLNHTYLQRGESVYQVDEQGLTLEQNDVIRVGATRLAVQFAAF